MKARRIMLLGAAALGLGFHAGPARGQVLFPTSGNVTAGDTFPFLVTFLNEDTNDPPTKIYMFSEDPDRLSVPSQPVTQATLYNPATSNFYYRSWLDGAEGLIAAGLKPVDGLFSPIRVHFVGVQYGIVWSDYADIVVDPPTFVYQPAAPALRVGETVPLAIRRTIDANATLNFQVQSAWPAVVGLGTNAVGLQTNASLNLQFGVFEISKTIYVSGLAAAQDAGSTNVTVTARVGSYATNVVCLVSTNAGLILAPASPSVGAGDAVAMTVTRPSATNVSALTVYLTSDDPTVVGVPASVVIPQGAQSVGFSATGLRPGSSFVRATAIGVEPGPGSAREVVVGNPLLAFDPDPATVPQAELRVITVRRPAMEAGGSLTVTLVNNAPTLFELSATNVTIPAGFADTTFTILGLSEGSGSLSARSGGYLTNLAVNVTAATNEDDPDGDGIPTDWELVLGSDPYDAFSLDPGLTLNDGEWDSDGEGLSNYEEIINYATDPLRGDTDDDGVDDRTEVRDDITSPLHPMSSVLYRERSLDLGAVPAGGIRLPDPSRFYVRTNGWTVECWLRPTTDGSGRVFALEGAGAGQSFRVSLEDFRPKAEILSGASVIASAGGVGPAGSIQQLPTNEWSHVAWAWGPQDNSLKIYVNGVLLIAQETLVSPDFSAGTGVLAQAFTDGYLDDARFWNYDRSWEDLDYWNNRFYPSPEGYVRPPTYGQSLRMYYRFDDGGSNTVDFAFLNQPAYFLPDTATMVVTNPAVSLLGRDDEDGDLLPEWWVTMHNLDQYPEFDYGPKFEYIEVPGNWARISYFRTFRAYTSVGNETGWAQPPDNLYHEPKDQGLGHDGRHSAFMKYVYLYSAPRSATLEIFTPGMESTLVYVNGELLTPTNDTANTAQSLDVAGRLKIGRNMVYVRCISSFDTWLDEARTQPVKVTDPPVQYERALGKFDARLTVDGIEHIVRGDTSRNDPRAAWFVQTWSTFWQMINGDEHAARPDKEIRFLPGNPDYGLPFDADTDDFNAWYEFLCGANPRDDDSNNNGIPDGLEDFDGDGLVNRGEQERGTHPLLPDTDDDRRVDGAEVGAGEDPASAQSPAISRALSFSTNGSDYVEMPMQRRFALDSWTLESWVRLAPGEADGGVLVQRVVGPSGVNYELGLGDGVTAPANVPYVRYVSVDGFTVQATGSVALAGGTNWTHVAGTYDGFLRELQLYTGGVYVATAPQALQSPAIYAGGPVQQRIGPGLQGAVDDVRIWSVARTASEIASSFDSALQGSEPNLVAYYRADDSTSYRTNPLVGTSANNGTNASVNVMPWTWGQVQDYVRGYSGDWWDKWNHAATLRGRAGHTADGDGALIIPPSLRVTLLPPPAVDDGAQWAIQGLGSWRDSGVTLYEGLDEGPQVILFKSIDGWTAPSNQTVTLSNGVLTSVTATYIQNGSLRVEFSFVDEATHGAIWPTDGAQWRIGSGVWHEENDTVDNLTPGEYIVQFKSIDGWVPPAPSPVTILSGETTLLLGQYVPATGSLRVFIEPEAVVVSGAVWRLDAGNWYHSGDFVPDIRVGEHTVSFTNIPLWLTPASLIVQITTDLTTVTGLYTQVTGIHVDMLPPEAVASGAQWRVAGMPWVTSNATLELAPGDYTVEFHDLPFWGQAPDVKTTVTNGSTTMIAGHYWPMEVYGPPGDTNAALTLTLLNPRGLAFDPLRRLYIADSDHHRLVILDTRDYSVTNLGVQGAAAGQFSQPFGVTVDRATNLYVADTGNNRIQRRSPAGTWTTWGGTSPGSAVGQFNAPYDVAVDAFTNLYVADRSNYRVQKRTPANVWSIFVSNGVEDAFVRLTKGVTVDSSNRLVVSDYDAGSDYSRIQIFATNQTFLGRIGSSTNSEGGLKRAQRMAYGLTNDLYVADMNNSRVVRRNEPGAWMTLLDDNVLDHPEGVAWDARGYLYIADTAHHRIVRIQVYQSPNVPPAIGSAVPGPGGLVIHWTGAAGWFYAVQYSNDMVNWITLPDASALPGVDGPMSFTDTGFSGLAYRVMAY
ncbi:MAG TPA: hypothetical protein P5567_04285 [Kiritimatiellia bacterium]|nr:hypothetical protein [Kiritimatiellia bacterium]HSA16793.1 hypothetical protein [Kiritimatiellia bacterium]